MNRFEDGYKIGDDTQRNFFCSNYTHNVRNENDYSLHEFKVYTESRKRPRKHYKNYVDFSVWCYCMGKRNKLKTIKQFRKELGIKGDKIKTAVFKFVFHLDFYDRSDNKKFKRLEMETMAFSFNKNADGTLVLEKEVKSHRCMKSSSA
ncbi:hypothetical protein CDIK_3392 [Cucumispora dikerogammari]|nr:hypothetical protein CDIK_3392 [Cucumispora dikerogammari]